MSDIKTNIEGLSPDELRELILKQARVITKHREETHRIMDQYDQRGVDLSKMEEEKAALEKELADTNDAWTERSNQIRELVEEQETTRQERDEARGQLVEQGTVLEQTEAELLEAKNDVAHLQEQLDAARDAVERTDIGLDELRQTVQHVIGYLLHQSSLLANAKGLIHTYCGVTEIDMLDEWTCAGAPYLRRAVMLINQARYEAAQSLGELGHEEKP